MTNEEKINLIGQKIMLLSKDLERYKTELDKLRAQLEMLQAPERTAAPIVNEEVKIPTPINIQETIQEDLLPPVSIVTAQPIPETQIHNKKQSSFNFEEFIGGKLISIIGIIILVIGLSIGVKYAIDRDLITPLSRIVLAYFAGGILLAITLKLKQNYKAFSAVLLSGAMASLYFTTFAAYSMYSLFPQLAAFAIMVIFTAFTVFAATMYELEIIGIIGLVGAYCVPVLLSDGSGKIQVMFCYMLIINSGILILSFKKYWKILNHISFAITWLIVGGWIAGRYDYTSHFPMAMIFSFLFFIIFYISNMSYKILKHEKFGVIDIIRLLSNSFIFFGIGYSILNNIRYENYLGLFTVANALIHLVFSYIVFKNKLLDRKLFYLLIAMVLSFITIAIPVQLDGNWVTLLWSAEAVLLFSIGRHKNVRFYEWLGAIMIGLSMFSLIGDWSHSYYVSYYDNLLFKFWTPFLNVYFLSSLLFVISISIIVRTHFKRSLSAEEYKTFRIYQLFDYLLPAILFIFIYLTFNNEISAIFKARYEQSYLKIPSKEYGDITEIYNYTIQKIGSVALGIYSVIFFIVATVLVTKKWQSSLSGWLIFSLNLVVVCLFMILGLRMLAELRTDYLSQNSPYYPISQWVIYLRYLCFILIGLLLFLTHKLLLSNSFSKFHVSKIYTGVIIHFFILVFLSNEIVNLNILNNLAIASDYYEGSNATYKLGFTALWGIYSFAMIAWGIFKRNRIMRISAITLFGVTLIKLVTYDTWDLSTGYKIIAFILLGIILLVVAFLYQKFKDLIFGDDEG